MSRAKQTEAERHLRTKRIIVRNILRGKRPEIRARRVFWRIKDDWLGKRERYSAATNQDLDYYDPLEATVSPYPICHGRRSAGEAI